MDKVKKEIVEPSQRKSPDPSIPPILIDLGSSDSDDDSDSDSSSSSFSGEKRPRSPDGGGFYMLKRRKKEKGSGVTLPVGFLDPLPAKEPVPAPLSVVPSVEENVTTAAIVPVSNANANSGAVSALGSCHKQFWKAGDYEGAISSNWETSAGGMDHVRVHPRFLHSNATSHKWVLGAFAELLDNSLDEAVNGANCVNIDMIKSNKDGSRMLLIEDNGGGMDPEKLRQCMSLGYSLKSKVANTIGQYGNGFKTSTMRLGADVIVFSRCSGSAGKRATQSIGLLSYTFLRSTGKEDIVVPMLDYERSGLEWKKMTRLSTADWDRNVETILQWSPFSSEAELSRQFNQMKDQGTRIIIYNLWEDGQGLLELDFDSDQHDIQIRGVNRDDKNIQMAHQYPNSRHFLTYRHSLRSYASILYLRVPPGFRFILRGKDVEHHNIVNDMMMTQEITYRPNPVAEGIPKDLNMVAVVTMGFVKDAKAHIDVQGYNVYHKNRLIRPFWRVWNAAGSDGRGVIGVLEANFVEPAHDKQGFERTIVLSRLETKLVQLQKTYWSTNCHRIGYAARRNKKFLDDREPSPDNIPKLASNKKKDSNVFSGKAPVLDSFGKHSSHTSGGKEARKQSKRGDMGLGSGKRDYTNGKHGKRHPMKSGTEQNHVDLTSSSQKDTSATDVQNSASEGEQPNGGMSHKGLSSKKFSRSGGFLGARSPSCLEQDDAEPACSSGRRADRGNRPLQSERDDVDANLGGSPSSYGFKTLEDLKEDNRELKKRLKREEEISRKLQQELQNEKDRNALLESELEASTMKIQDMNKEQDSLIDVFSEERARRDIEEENLRKKLKEASNTIRELLEQVRLLERR
ncbi:protein MICRORCHIDIA 7 [Daucus carota subsp. sativus]|uniref:Morc S5 domain-containing protein n=1 Tax=Daucus carota subsp. sativus TaxID=79200 RepID=A0A161ZV66_DAUCS|nr:PREDICTED: protein MICRORCHIDIA 7-like [Daucus carota subsp. sativus]